MSKFSASPDSTFATRPKSLVRLVSSGLVLCQIRLIVGIALITFDARRTPTVRRRWGPAIVALQAVKIEVVSKVSNLQKLGIVAKVAKQQAGRSRTLGAIKSAASTTLRSLGHALHQLWLEVTGTLFLAIALFGAAAFVHEYMQYQAGRATLGRVAVALCFTLAFAWFGLTSFWRVRRKSQRP